MQPDLPDLPLPQAEALRDLLALTMLEGVGPVTARNLLAYCGGASEVFRQSGMALAQVPGVGPKLSALIGQKATHARAEAEIEWCAREGVLILPWGHPLYPQILRAVYDTPLVLYQRGALNLNTLPGIGIVGTRKPSPSGKRIAGEFAGWLASFPVNIVSGLAYGIDIAAHKATLEMGGITTAVLGHGLDVIYPAAHANIARQITDSGCLLTEYPSGTKTDGRNFPFRNRIIAGLSRAIVVVEALERGGTLTTARLAFDSNREVYAVPGPIHAPTSAGANRLIRDHVAKLITHPEEIFLDQDWDIPGYGGPRKPTLDLDQHPDLSETERSILLYLRQHSPCQLDALADALQLPVSDLMSQLLVLEFKGLVRQEPGRKFSLA
jgi:DNA processing protein